MNTDKIIATIPLSAYDGVISAVVILYGWNYCNVSLAFKKGDEYITNSPMAWAMTKDETIKIANALSEASLYTKTK